MDLQGYKPLNARTTDLLTRLSPSDRDGNGSEIQTVMIYQQSPDIESRLARLLELIQTGINSTPTLATTLNVSMPTVACCIHALRRRGHPITAVRNGSRWCYEMTSETRESPSHPGRQ